MLSELAQTGELEAIIGTIGNLKKADRDGPAWASWIYVSCEC